MTYAEALAAYRADPSDANAHAVALAASAALPVDNRPLPSWAHRLETAAAYAAHKARAR